MSPSLYSALQANRPLSPSVIREGRDISQKTIKHTMVFIRRMDNSIRTQVSPQGNRADEKRK